MRFEHATAGELRILIRFLLYFWIYPPFTFNHIISGIAVPGFNYSSNESAYFPKNAPSPIQPEIPRSEDAGDADLTRTSIPSGSGLKNRVSSESPIVHTPI